MRSRASFVSATSYDQVHRFDTDALSILGIAKLFATAIRKTQSRNFMGNRLYVGNLSFSTSQQAIEAAFAAAGEVREVAMPTDRETGQPR